MKEDIAARAERVRTSTLIKNHPTVTYTPRAPVPKKFPALSAKSAKKQKRADKNADNADKNADNADKNAGQCGQKCGQCG